MSNSESQKIWKFSQKYLVGGVNSPVRAFKSVSGKPIAIRSGKGAYITDYNGNKYLDFLNSWGALILGHAHPRIVRSIQKQASRGSSFGTITTQELELASLIVDNIPQIEKIRFVNSGTEAVMTAVRLARGITQKNLIIKFNGCYHGHTDSMLVAAGSGLITKTKKVSNSKGLTHSTMKETITLSLDDEDSLEKTFNKHPNRIAAVIIEPLPANSGLLPQRTPYLKKIQRLCRKNHTLLIFDEVITGFRLGFSGFCGKYGFSPDLITYGKVIGGGMPIGALAGRSKWMKHLAPEGDIYQAGTLSGNPIAMSAGISTLNYLLSKDVYSHLKELSQYMDLQFSEKISPLFSKKHFFISLIQQDSIFWLSISPNLHRGVLRKPELIWEKAPDIYRHLFWSFIHNGIYVAPSGYEVGFISHPMQKKDIDRWIHSLRYSIEGI